jgi:hypothetical protein
VKILDNILSRHPVVTVTRGRQGLARRLPMRGVLQLAVAIDLANGLAMPVSRALDVAANLLADPEHRSQIGPVAITLDVRGLEASIEGRLRDAVELVVRRPRGRPAQRRGDDGAEVHRANRYGA